MRKKLIGYSVGIAVIITLLMFSLGLVGEHQSNLKQAETEVISIAKIYTDIYDGENSVIEKSSENIRITVMNKNGIVIADTDVSDLSSLENHASREEVAAAIDGTPKVVVRSSTSTGAETIYYALKKDMGSEFVIIRAAVSVQSVNAYLLSSLPWAISILVLAIGVSVLLAYLLSSKMMMPIKAVKDSLSQIEKGQYVPKAYTERTDELNQILSDIDSIGNKLNANIFEVSSEKEKLGFILDNISDAIIVIDEKKTIRLVNLAACTLFNLKGIVGQFYGILGLPDDFAAFIEKGLTSSQSTTAEVELFARIFSATIKPISGKAFRADGAVAIILTDITSFRKNAQMRSDFFANAGHELKSPLTAISGFAEILQAENHDEKLKVPVENIAKNAQRMTALVDDMLKLSNLESGKSTDALPIKLELIAEEVIADLSALAEEKGVRVVVSGEGVVTAGYDHVYSLLKNLAENAVKYNHQGGKVKIGIKETDSRVVLSVTDDGIGIAEEHQSRIFERFYRVDKGRSRKEGGTGLGLAIVKHICLLYNADLTLQSRIGLGTKVTVVFYKA